MRTIHSITGGALIAATLVGAAIAEVPDRPEELIFKELNFTPPASGEPAIWCGLGRLAMLEQDNVVGTGKTLQDLGITPTPMEAILPTYLYRFRPYGQYAALRPKGEA